jgi:hypothetical protein
MFGNSTAAGCGSGSLPVFWGQNFINAWQAFIAATIAKYGLNPSVVYFRLGFGIGFENHPALDTATSGPCNTLMASYGYSTSVWISYLEAMAAYEAPLSYGIQFSLNYTTYGTPDYSTPLTTGAAAAALGLRSAARAYRPAI